MRSQQVCRDDTRHERGSSEACEHDATARGRQERPGLGNDRAEWCRLHERLSSMDDSHGGASREEEEKMAGYGK